MLNWLKFKFNTGEINPVIESMLQRYEYEGLTDQDDPINRIAKSFMVDENHTRVIAKSYLNIYQFKVDGRQFYLCDREVVLSFVSESQNCILAAGKAFPLGFEITTNDYFISNDCESVEKIGKCDMRVEEPDEYEGQKSFLISVLPHCERFSTHSEPISFFSFPEDKLLGYHVTGRYIAQDETDSAISLLQRFP